MNSDIASKMDADKKFRDFETFEIPANLIMLSNHPPAFIEPKDRRFFVSKWEHQFDNAEAKSKYFKDYTDWLFNKKGLEAIAWLLKSTQVTIEPTQEALVTDEKRMAMEVSVHPAVEEIRGIIEDYGDRVLYRLEDFESLFSKQGINDTKRQSHFLIEAGLTKQEPIRTSIEGKQKRASYFTANNWMLKKQNGKTPVLVRDGIEIDPKNDAGWFRTEESSPWGESL